MVEGTRNENSAGFLAHKNLLLDTCFIIKTKENFSFFEELFSLFLNNDCQTTIHPFIKNEFLRGSATNTFINDKITFLKQIELYPLPITEDIIEDSILLSNLYSNKRILNNQISIVDCINAAFLKKYNHNLFLVTTDYKDYPLVVFDRKYIHTIDTGAEIINCCFYEFNNHKFTNALNDFHKT